MSHGIGRLQRDILQAIPVYRTEPLAWWRGGEVTPSGTMWCVSGGQEWEPPVDVIDIRGVSNYLARRQGKAPAFSAAFSRAVVGLVRRGVLVEVRPSLVRRRFFRLSANQNRLTLSRAVEHAELIGDRTPSFLDKTGEPERLDDSGR